jgi:transposase InsO family protein
MANEKLLVEIKAAFQNSRKTYGSPFIHRELHKNGIVFGRNRAARLIRLKSIRARRPRRKYPRTTQRAIGAIAAPNLLNQDFTAAAPNQIWVSDITYVDTLEGWLYLAAVMDLLTVPLLAGHLRIIWRPVWWTKLSEWPSTATIRKLAGYITLIRAVNTPVMHFGRC